MAASTDRTLGASSSTRLRAPGSRRNYLMERFRQLQEKTSLPAPVEAGRGGAIAAQSDPEPFMGSHSKVWPHGTRETMQRSAGLFVILRPFGRW